MEGLSAGETIPNAVLYKSNGEEINTQLWRGSPTLLVLFKSSCSACRKQIANLEEISEWFPGVRIALLSLNGMMPSEKVAFTVYFDPGGDFVRRMRKLRVPVLYWIGPDGQVKYVRTGCREVESDAMLFRSLLETEAVSDSVLSPDAPAFIKKQEIVNNKAP